MVDPEVLQRRLQKLEQLLRGLEGLRSISLDEFMADARHQAVAERWLHLSAECVLDVAHHVIADQRWREPTSFKDAIEVLLQEGVLDAPLCGELVPMAGLRNVLVHMYLDVNAAIVHAVVQTKLDVFRDFGRQVQAWFDGQVRDP